MTTTLGARHLYDDRRGAIMLTGLVMSCFLIGALWLIIGLGDAIVFRNEMQEAADHGAFAAAALNAKGMNFISLLNLVMIAGTVVYLALGIASDLVGVVHSLCLIDIGGCAEGCILDALTGGFFGSCPTYTAWKTVFKVWDGYYQVYSKGLEVVHGLEEVASYAYPVIGTATAYSVGHKYDAEPGNRHGPVDVLALSSSMVPLPNKTGFLPVEEKPYKGLCEQVVSVGTNMLVSAAGGGKVAGSNGAGAVLGMFDDIVGGLLQMRYCNPGDFPIIGQVADLLQPVCDLIGEGDLYHPEELCGFPLSGQGPGTKNKFWDKKGYMVVYTGAQNGNPLMQSYGIVLSAQLMDDAGQSTADSKVHFAATKPTAISKYATPGSGNYYAQAEMYFNCDQVWSSVSCNFKDNATFAINWRARLKKLDFPAIASGGANIAYSLGVDALTSALGKGISKLGGNVVDQAVIQNTLAIGTKWLNGQVGNVAEKFDPKAPGVYH